MIAYLSGTVKTAHKNYLILVVQDIGYKVFVSPQILLSISPGQKLSLYIHTYVREDQLSLYGFTSLAELDFFELLLGVSGIGAKLALSVMSAADLEIIKSGIVNEDPSVFTKISGIGRKTAERLIVELKEKVSEEAEEKESLKTISQASAEVIDVLLALGYSRSEARKAVISLPKDLSRSEDKIREALRFLAKQ